MVEIATELDEIQKVFDSYDLDLYKRERWNRDDFEEIVSSERYKERFPEKKLDRKFRELLRPFHYFFGSKTIYCKRSRIVEDEEGETEYIFSVINSSMISVDRAFFGEEFNPDEKVRYSILDFLYKPYIYELSVSNLPKEILDNLDEGVWYKADISKYYWYLLSRHEREKLGEEEKEREIRLWQYREFDAERNLHERELHEKYQDYNINLAKLSYGASPLDTREVKIRWNNEIVASMMQPLTPITQTDIDNYCNKHTSAAINNQINILFDKDIHRKVIIKRFGQANTIIVKNKKTNGAEVFFAFDLGLPIDRNMVWDDDNELDTVASQIFDSVDLSSFNPQVIFISHWHLDHFKAAYTLNRDAFLGDKASVWIVPKYIMDSYSGNPCSADRLISFLMTTKRVLFVDEPTKPNVFEEIYNSSSVSLYRVKKGTNLNNDCIMLQLNQTLMTGDCDYKNWVYDCKRTNSIKCLVAPHHGAICSITSREEDKLKNDYTNIDVVYICVGLNGYGHPKKKIKDMYENAGNLNIPHVYYTNDIGRNRSDFKFIDM